MHLLVASLFALSFERCPVMSHLGVVTNTLVLRLSCDSARCNLLPLVAEAGVTNPTEHARNKQTLTRCGLMDFALHSHTSLHTFLQQCTVSTSAKGHHLNPPQPMCSAYTLTLRPSPVPDAIGGGRPRSWFFTPRFSSCFRAGLHETSSFGPLQCCNLEIKASSWPMKSRNVAQNALNANLPDFCLSRISNI